MRLTEFMVIIIAALMFLIPTMKKEKTAFEREAQEEAPMEEIMEEANTYKVVFEVQKPSEEGMADIIWMKKAAEIAKDAGVPYFNVLEQKIRKQYVEKFKRELSVVEGVIELDNDPMRAEFDAQEIESLVLTERQ
jgi:CO dehydrogenase nickel-insertion accessory protein CooC1